MKKLRGKGILQKIIMVLIILIIINFIFPAYSRAAWWGGGTLFTPISEFICGVGDAVINTLQSYLLPGSPTAVDKTSPAQVLKSMYQNQAIAILGVSDADMVQIVENNGDALIEATLDGNYINKLCDIVEEVKNKEIGESQRNQLTDLSNKIAEIDINSSMYAWLGWLVWDQNAKDFNDDRIIPSILYSPAAIFSNIIPALDINFVNPNISYGGGIVTYEAVHGYAEDNGGWGIRVNYTPNDEAISDDEKYSSNTAYQLRDTIATWYNALRNIAIVGLLSVLIYIAIRIIMSSTAGETAKYKSMLKDWLVAMCILFFMHYMMAFLLKATEMVTSLLSDTAMSSYRVENLRVDKFMCQVRAAARSSSDNAGLQFGYTLMYVILVFYTLIFTWKYLKRFIYLAFLTMISPMVALTYPIDKLKDGHAQAFNKWFKEYVFNVLIQPIHLLLYTILITSAQSFAETNLIYAIVALGFMLEAEKIVKSLFGFNSEGGISAAGAAVTGGAIFGAVANLVQKGANKLPGGSSSSKGSSGSSKEGKVNYYNRDSDSDATKNLAAFNNGDSGSIGGAANIRTANASGPVNTGGAGGGTNPTASARTGKYNYRLFNAASNAYHKAGTPYRAVKGGIQRGVSRISSSRPVGGIRKLGSDIARTPVGRTIKGVGRVAGRFINKDNAKKAVRLAAMGVGAATLGTIGLAAGIASDNDGDVLKYAGLGAGAGALVGGKAYDTASALGRGASGVKDSFQQGFYGSEYEDKILNPRLDKEWKHDKDVINYYRTKYGDGYKAKMQDSLQLRKAGITDQKEIDTAIKLMDKNPGLNVDQAANIMQFTNGISRSDVLNAERWNGIRDSAKKMVGNSDEQADKIMRLVNQRFKLHKNLHFSDTGSGNTETTE